MMTTVFTAALVVGMTVVIHWANVWTAKHELEPLRDHLAARLKEF